MRTRSESLAARRAGTHTLRRKFVERRRTAARRSEVQGTGVRRNALQMSVEHGAEEPGQRYGSRLMSLGWSEVESGADLGQRLGHLDPASQQVASAPSDRRRLAPPNSSVRKDVRPLSRPAEIEIHPEALGRSNHVGDPVRSPPASIARITTPLLVWRTSLSVSPLISWPSLNRRFPAPRTTGWTQIR
jgi:hypothetical protein